ncbi:hypothetical protein HQ571_00330 [Candidatus Kuenenbacteria bacterium]|nr:hypothetical protein [Candidatus Kuenenbacteria bacterium]
MSFETAKRPDFKPRVEVLEDGRKRYTIRVRRPEARSRAVKDAQTRKDQTKDGYLHTQDIVDYKKLMGGVGSPESLDMGEPKLEIAFVRHLDHINNIVSEEAKEGFKPRVRKILDEMKIDNDTKVFIITTETGQFQDTAEGIRADRRTEQTAEVIQKELASQGIDYALNDLDGEKGQGITPMVQGNFVEMPVDGIRLAEVRKQMTANKEAEQADGVLPYPEAIKLSPFVQASEAKNVKELEEQTGVQEVASATVARNLKSFDHIEHHFLKGEGRDVIEKGGKVVVLVVAHGQMGTDMSEALNDSTNEKFPILIASNGAYWRVKVAEDKNGDKVEEFIFETGKKTTGLFEIQ